MSAVKFTIPGRPVPASRPRVTKNGTFYPQRYRDWLDAAKVYARQAWLGKEPLSGPVKVEITFYGTTARADLDNLVKGALDALTGTLVRDDRQVEKLDVWRTGGLTDNPRTVVVLEGAE